MFMNNLNEIPKTEIQFFKEKVTRWLLVDKQISDLQTQIKELKKVRDKELQPEITNFMVSNNVSDLNTENGKLRCNVRNTKKSLNKTNIRENLCKVINDMNQIDKAMELILNNREIVTSYKLTKPKK